MMALSTERFNYLMDENLSKYLSFYLSNFLFQLNVE